MEQQKDNNWKLHCIVFSQLELSPFCFEALSIIQRSEKICNFLDQNIYVYIEYSEAQLRSKKNKRSENDDGLCEMGVGFFLSFYALVMVSYYWTV